MERQSLTEMESITPAPETQEGGGAVVTSLGWRVAKSEAAFPEPLARFSCHVAA